MSVYPKPETMEAIRQEVYRARVKFPSKNGRLQAFHEESLELVRAINDKEGLDRVRGEAVQVAATMVRLIEELDEESPEMNI